MGTGRGSRCAPGEGDGNKRDIRTRAQWQATETASRAGQPDPPKSPVHFFWALQKCGSSRLESYRFVSAL